MNASPTPIRRPRAVTISSSGLERDAAGRFYTASSKWGLLRIAADGQLFRSRRDRLSQSRRPRPGP